LKSNKSKIQEKARIEEIIHILSQVYSNVRIQLDYSNQFELLVATILSAQCTDARVNTVTKELFMKYKNINDYASAMQEELELDIFSTGFYKSKAKNIITAAQKVLNDHNGQMPNKMKDLLELPGVGRKTANVILGHCFEVTGIVVDTHVIRLSNRMGFVETKDAVKIEFKLMELIPKIKWVIFTHYFINLGRNVCLARKPSCSICPVHTLCRKIIL